MVEVFTTNIFTHKDATEVLQILSIHFPELKINFDLEDAIDSSPCCHSILRVEGLTLYPEQILNLVINQGYQCGVLEDKVCAK